MTTEPVRKLAVALMLSGALNIALLALFFYREIQDRPPVPYFQLKPAEKQPLTLSEEQGFKEILKEYQNLPVEQLLATLNISQIVENGYTHRDIALSCLTAFHHFDLERALAGLPFPKEKRLVTVVNSGEKKQVILFPGLNEEQFEAIIHFASTEKWPFSGEGLFLLLKNPKYAHEPSLIEAFYLTSEFRAVELLFSRSAISVEKQDLLKMLISGEWKQLHVFSEQQKMLNDLSPERRQGLLLDYVACKSKSAAGLLVKLDGEFAAKKLADKDTQALLELLVDKSPEAEKFALELLTSPRSNAVWHLAAVRLYEFANEPVPQLVDYAKALSHFAPQRIPQFTMQAPVDPETPKKIEAIKLAEKPPTPSPMPAPKVITVQKPMEKQPPKQIAETAVKPVVKAAAPSSPREFTYVVQEGDTLQKVAVRYSIDAEILKYYNRLSSNEVRPGSILKIPAMKASTKKGQWKN